MTAAKYEWPTSLEPERYFELIDSDTERMLEVGGLGLDAAVPSCPGWTVADVVDHQAMVYSHKVRVMADNGWPDPWPPAELTGRPPVEFLREAKDAIFQEFANHDVAEQTTTFGDDTSVMFWARRMALEVAVHRIDVELAHDAVTPIPDDLATDGVDEILQVMLHGNWAEWGAETKHPVDAAVAVETGGFRWRIAATEAIVDVVAGSSEPADATVVGDPDDVFLWLWGRRGDDAVRVSGDKRAASELRERLAESGQ
ncbi:MAG TPA: maleylpyruvate isomerase family mycothiol-dependent enzyme [Nocardioidaceae bacterium]|nr:maleylpyruvate isomerase family mycothiol-dependent enzyme [Nocardioidaceae bacterium]